MIQTLDIKTKMYLAGKWKDTEEKLQVWNPEDDQLIAEVATASKADMLHAIEVAKEGAEVSAKLNTYESIEILTRAADYIEPNASDFTNILGL